MGSLWKDDDGGGGGSDSRCVISVPATELSAVCGFFSLTPQPSEVTTLILLFHYYSFHCDLGHREPNHSTTMTQPQKGVFQIYIQVV